MWGTLLHQNKKTPKLRPAVCRVEFFKGTNYYPGGLLLLLCARECPPARSDAAPQPASAARQLA